MTVYSVTPAYRDGIIMSYRTKYLTSFPVPTSYKSYIFFSGEKAHYRNFGKHPEGNETVMNHMTEKYQAQLRHRISQTLQDFSSMFEL